MLVPIASAWTNTQTHTSGGFLSLTGIRNHLDYLQPECLDLPSVMASGFNITGPERWDPRTVTDEPWAKLVAPAGPVSVRKHRSEYLPEVPRLVGGASWNCDLAESRRGANALARCFHDSVSPSVSQEGGSLLFSFPEGRCNL